MVCCAMCRHFGKSSTVVDWTNLLADTRAFAPPPEEEQFKLTGSQQRALLRRGKALLLLRALQLSSWRSPWILQCQWAKHLATFQWATIYFRIVTTIKVVQSKGFCVEHIR